MSIRVQKAEDQLDKISTLSSRPMEQRAPSYEPLGLMLLLPILFRVLHRPQSPAGPLASTQIPPRPPTLAMSPPLTPPLTPQETILLSKTNSYDERNTYLTPPALGLPERQCTLCLESRGTGEGSGGTVAVTECGHVFCWGCLGGLEKVSKSAPCRIFRLMQCVSAGMSSLQTDLTHGTSHRGV